MPDVDFNPHALLARDGPIARRLGDLYEPRPQQHAMLDAVARTMADRSTLLVEAGTGVGKSFAYLLPAIARVVEHKERVVVATNTIALQEQLIDRDIPLLRAALPVEFSAVLVKGRGNYLSVRRLMLASRRQERLFAGAAEVESLHTIEDWAYETRDGTLATLPTLQRMSVWEKAQSDAGNCMGRKCPTYDKCFYQAARRRMQRGDLLICNHALFFADLALRKAGASLLPEHDHVVIDEAHAAEDVACEHFGLSLTTGRVQRLLATLVSKGGKRGYLPNLRVPIDVVSALDGTVHMVFAAGAAADDFFAQVRRFVADVRPQQSARRKRDAGESGQSRQSHAQTRRVRDAAALLDKAASESVHMVEAFRKLAMALRQLRERDLPEEDAFEINAFAQRASAIAGDLESLANQAEEGSVYWAQADGAHGLRARSVCLRSSPVDIGPTLRESLFSQDRSVVLTSATLAGAKGSFSHVAARLGVDLDEDATEALLLDSPFDHAQQSQLFVDLTMPDPRAPAYLDALAERVFEHALATQGGAFGLFTSDATMRAVAYRVRERMLDAGLTLVVQGVDGARSEILERFRTVHGCVLFGLATFWQGVDVRGDMLRNVIITRLPFDPPDRPIVEARLERIKEQGRDPFFAESLPRAVLRFKQGFGRLIRSASDAGRVVVLDPRIVTKGYGKAFLRALPEGVEPRIINNVQDEKDTALEWREP